MNSREILQKVQAEMSDTRSGKPIHECSAHYLEAIFKVLCILAENHIPCAHPPVARTSEVDAIADLMGPEPKKKTNGRRGRPAIKSR